MAPFLPDWQILVWSFLAVIFLGVVLLALFGQQLAQVFIWVWALGMVLAIPLVTGSDGIQSIFLASGTGIVLVLLIGKRELDKAHSEIRRLLAESNKRMDDERRRIARQLHDEVNPRLVLTKMEAQQLVPYFEQIPDEDIRAAAADAVKHLIDSIGAAYAQSRDIIKQTRMEIVDSIGIIAALESLVGHYRGIVEKPTIEFKHNLPEKISLPKGLAANLYRIIQEALLNAVKHAHADNVLISLRQENGDRMTLTVQDDGTGIRQNTTDGIGLIDMRERANVIGGKLDINTRPTGGTTISLSFSRPN